MSRLTCSMLIPAVVGLLTSAPCVSAASPEGIRRALIVGAGGCPRLRPAPYLDRGAEALRERLLQCGFDADDVVYLTADTARGEQASTAENFRRELQKLVDHREPSDLLLVAVSAYGVHLQGTDYLCLADAAPETIVSVARPEIASGSKVPGLVPVQEILAILGTSSTKHQLLLVDAPGSRSPLPSRSASAPHASFSDRFGTESLVLTGGAWILCSQSGALTSDETGAMTRFTRSIIDGLARHADANGDRSVSLLEITEYAQTYAESEGFARPTVQGKLNMDAAIARTSRSRAATELSLEWRESLFARMRDLAATALVIENDPAAALAALVRAAEYADRPETKREAEGLRCTALAAAGGLEKAWHRSQQLGRPLHVLVPSTCTVYAQADGQIRFRNQRAGALGRRTVRVRYRHDPAAGTLAAGTLVRVTEWSGRRVQFDQPQQRQAARSSIVFEPLDEQPQGWIDVAALSSPDSARPPLTRVLSQLYED